MNPFETIRSEADSRILIASHRGICGGNIPPNTLEAFEIGLRSGADIIECDITKLKDGTLVMFHPGTELECTSLPRNTVETMTWDELKTHHLHSLCRARTQYPFYTLDDTLEFLKDRCYINLDKCWMNLPEIVQTVRRHKMEEQCLLKSDPEERYLQAVEEVAPDIAYMPVYRGKDIWTDDLLKRNIRFWGAELVFPNPDNELASDAYIKKMRSLGKRLWINAIVFNFKTVLSGGHTDDLALTTDPDDHWGWFADRYDIIQTDWPYLLREYLIKSGKYQKNR